MRRLRHTILLLGPALAVTLGCDLTRQVAPEPVLSAAAARDAFGAMLKVEGFQIGFAGQRGGTAGVAAREAGLELAMNRTENCPDGGWTTLTGQLLGDESTGLVGMIYDQSLSNCLARGVRNRVWNFHGERALHTRFIARYDTLSRTASITGKVEGALNVSGQGYYARCDLQFDILVVDDVGHFVGTLCGVSVSEPYVPPR